MLTTDYLREHGLSSLCEKYHIKASRGREFPNLVLLKYNQIESPMGEKIIQECRGLVVDEEDNWKVVCRSYDKFFSAHEGHAAPIDWNTAKVYEKLDGSILTLHRYRDRWQVASSGLPDAAGDVYGHYCTFAELFWKTWEKKGYKLPAGDAPIAYIFELMSPLNRIIVQHRESNLVLHGVRYLGDEAMQEVDPEGVAGYWGWECVKSFPLTSFDDCLAAAKKLKPMECEGYVVRDANFNRVKIKSTQYVALAHLKDGMSTRRLIEIVRTNESDEFLSYFPEFKTAYHAVRVKFDALRIVR